VSALVGGQATNEEGYLIGRLMREGLSSGDLDCRADGAPSVEVTRALASPGLQAAVPDLEFAHTVLVLGCEPLDDAPILDLWIRKGVRRRGVRLAVATPRPSALDSNAQTVVRYEPGGEAELIEALSRGESDLAGFLREGGEDIVIVWGERIGSAAALLPGLAEALGIVGREGAGLLEIPVVANGRGLREAGVLPAGEIDGEPTALYLFETDPLRDRSRPLWEQKMRSAALVVAHSSVLTEGLAEHADVVFPADIYAEKDGTVVHPDGRIQRLRTAIAHPGEVRAGWWVIAEVAKRCGLDLGVLTASMAFRQLVDAVPYYEGLTLEEIGGRGVRWPEREQASAYVVGDNFRKPKEISQPAAQPGENGALRLGTYKPIWAAPEVEISPSLQYTIARQQAELSPEDARRLGIASGDKLEVSQNGTRLEAAAVVRSGIPEGTVFLATGIRAESANSLVEPFIDVRKLT
jgi:NADH-quinone oxidoreductase subunit G